MIKARNSGQTRFCDKTAYVGIQDFSLKQRISWNFVQIFLSFVPPWFRTHQVGLRQNIFYTLRVVQLMASLLFVIDLEKVF